MRACWTQHRKERKKRKPRCFFDLHCNYEYTGQANMEEQQTKLYRVLFYAIVQVAISQVILVYITSRNGQSQLILEFPNL